MDGLVSGLGPAPAASSVTHPVRGHREAIQKLDCTPSVELLSSAARGWTVQQGPMDSAGGLIKTLSAV